eukprot:TRINITY_DN4210_c0_g1_i1.p1 TRINITY_DN4210_c0_g1~~TRINITY_DN4210_c0_g1_i1.p1  ORF type:complete len:116 (+),score=24.25 TRINITY_DN4210_c0_g1_i1:425-772(+)
MKWISSSSLSFLSFVSSKSRARGYAYGIWRLLLHQHYLPSHLSPLSSFISSPPLTRFSLKHLFLNHNQAKELCIDFMRAWLIGGFACFEQRREIRVESTIRRYYSIIAADFSRCV